MVEQLIIPLNSQDNWQSEKSARTQSSISGFGFVDTKVLAAIFLTFAFQGVVRMLVSFARADCQLEGICVKPPFVLSLL